MARKWEYRNILRALYGMLVASLLWRSRVVCENARSDSLPFNVSVILCRLKLHNRSPFRRSQNRQEHQHYSCAHVSCQALWPETILEVSALSSRVTLASVQWAHTCCYSLEILGEFRIIPCLLKETLNYVGIFVDLHPMKNVKWGASVDTPTFKY